MPSVPTYPEHEVPPLPLNLAVEPAGVGVPGGVGFDLPGGDQLRRLFHVSPTDFAPGERLVPGAVCGRVTTRDSSGAKVYVTDSLSAARVWARYVGERSLAERVAIYDVLVAGELAQAGARRGVPQVAALEADAAVVLGCLEWVNPWEGRPPGYRAALAAVPF